MARLLFAQATLSEATAKLIPIWSRRYLPNVSRSAKLERGHKHEVTLIDYLELICIFRLVMCVGNSTNWHSSLNDVFNYALITTGSCENK